MRTRHIKKAAIVFYLMVFFSISVSSQETKIIGLQYLGSDNLYVSTYDYTTHEEEQLFILPESLRLVNNCITYDPYRQIYYYIRGKGACGDPPGHVITSINVNEQTLNELYRLPSGFVFLDIQYEPYLNSIMIRGRNNMYYYNIETGQLSEDCDIFPSFGIMADKSEYFNTLENKYGYRASGRSTHHRVYVDLNECTYDTISYSALHVFAFIQKYDFITNTVYGIAHIKNVEPDRCNFIKFDPNTGAFDSISNIANYNIEGGSQGAVMDSYNGKYILYYKNMSNEYEIAIIDILTGEMEVSPYDFHASSLYIKQSTIPLLKYENDDLVGSYCENYKWYCDNEIIENATGQIYTPTKNGLYKFSTSYNGVDTVFSNEIYVTIFSGINSQQSQGKIFAHPNPTTGLLNLTFESEVKIQSISLVDMYGNLLQRFDKISGNIIQLDLTSFSKGSYYLKIAFTNKAVTKKIIKI